MTYSFWNDYVILLIVLNGLLYMEVEKNEQFFKSEAENYRPAR